VRLSGRKGRKAEDGVIPDQYALQETDSANYLVRTEQNVIDSDGTVVFSIKPLLSGGSKKTAEFAVKHGKPLLHLHPGIETPGQELAAFIRTNGIKVLNVAGSRLSGEPRIAEFVVAALKAANLRNNRGGSCARRFCGIGERSVRLYTE